jgi:hypothetical protein
VKAVVPEPVASEPPSSAAADGEASPED